ncbi:hypothetical protein [Stappia sp. ES.058]|uniref:hypothetical protein n=1 Tax=Stappia sp. ES.058 TaxID=1881061 RepID=UPI00087A4778|nr:hypothetical protein [Stappia sp. ES.058]SDT96749.1 hypothetical protein SAMN05428979_0788 [Stappia sp. ES.058]
MTDERVVEIFDEYSKRLKVYALGAGESGTVTVTYTAEQLRDLQVCSRNMARGARLVPALKRRRLEIEAERRGLEISRKYWRALADEKFGRGMFFAAAHFVFIQALLAWWLP